MKSTIAITLYWYWCIDIIALESALVGRYTLLYRSVRLGNSLIKYSVIVQLH